ncbi:MAG: S9 family peptidase [Henriciella sp.]|uniref:alpha/beta hydrolase family protein n=1 Tax=Henriciella sp. TaxID=1968823 RepID=UPI003C758F3F
MFRSVALAICSIAIACSCANAEASKPPIEAYGSLPKVIATDISPDGSKVALVMNTSVGVVLVIYEKGKGTTKRFDANAVRTNGVLFADNDTVVIKASEAAQTWGFRGQYEYSAAIAMDLQSGDAMQLLSRASGLFPAQSGLGRVVGRRDDGTLMMPAFVGEARSDPAYSLMKANPDSGYARVEQKGTRQTIDWFVDAQGEPLFREDYNNSRNTYSLQFHDGKRWREVTEIDAPEIPFATVAVTEDQTGLYFISNDDVEGGFSSISRINSDGTIDRALFFRENADIEHVLHDINRKFLGVQYSGTFPSYDIVDSKLKKSVDATLARFQNARVELESWSENRDFVLYTLFDGYSVPLVFLHDVKADDYTMLSRSYDDIPDDAVGIVYAIEYPARDGLAIPAIVTTPPGVDLAAGVKLPMIVMPHGGPQSHDVYGFDWMAQFFANRGYVVLQPNFRGSSGFGGDFTAAGSGEWGGKMQDDVTDGVQAMIKNGFADPDRICIVGASYGGYSALMGGATTPDLYKCVAAVAPVTDLPKMMGDAIRERGRDHWVVAYWRRIMAKGDTSTNKLKEISPIEHAAAFKAPVILIHGEDDTVVDFDQSRAMERALKREDADVELVRLKTGDHWMRTSENRLATLRALDAFVEKSIGGQVSELSAN